MTKPPHMCSRCPTRWDGYLTAHCASCHETFTGITAFDKHRTGSQAKRSCLSPDSVGLVDAERNYSCWALPEKREDRE